MDNDSRRRPGTKRNLLSRLLPERIRLAVVANDNKKPKSVIQLGTIMSIRSALNESKRKEEYTRPVNWVPNATLTIISPPTTQPLNPTLKQYLHIHIPIQPTPFL